MQEKSTATKELKTMFSADKVIIDGKEISLKAFSWGQVIQVAAPMKVIVSAVVKNIDSLDSVLAAFKTDKVKALLQLNEMADSKTITDVMNALTQIISVATCKTRDEINNLAPDEIISLIRVIYTVNEDFFKRRVAGKITLPKNSKKK